MVDEFLHRLTVRPWYYLDIFSNKAHLDIMFTRKHLHMNSFRKISPNFRGLQQVYPSIVIHPSPVLLPRTNQPVHSYKGSHVGLLTAMMIEVFYLSYTHTNALELARCDRKKEPYNSRTTTISRTRKCIHDHLAFCIDGVTDGMVSSPGVDRGEKMSRDR